MGAVSGKKVKARHSRTAGMGVAGSEITGSEDICMAFASDEEYFTQLQEMWAVATPSEKEALRTLLQNPVDECFEDMEVLQSHFAMLHSENF